MTSRSKKLLIAIFIATVLVLGIVWAINGYEDTWLYVTALIIAIPTSWISFKKKGDDQK